MCFKRKITDTLESLFSGKEIEAIEEGGEKTAGAITKTGDKVADAIDTTNSKIDNTGGINTGSVVNDADINRLLQIQGILDRDDDGGLGNNRINALRSERSALLNNLQDNEDYIKERKRQLQSLLDTEDDYSKRDDYKRELASLENSLNKERTILETHEEWKKRVLGETTNARCSST